MGKSSHADNPAVLEYAATDTGRRRIATTHPTAQTVKPILTSESGSSPLLVPRNSGRRVQQSSGDHSITEQAGVPGVDIIGPPQTPFDSDLVQLPGQHGVNPVSIRYVMDVTDLTHESDAFVGAVGEATPDHQRMSMAVPPIPVTSSTSKLGSATRRRKNVKEAANEPRGHTTDDKQLMIGDEEFRPGTVNRPSTWHTGEQSSEEWDRLPAREGLQSVLREARATVSLRRGVQVFVLTGTDTFDLARIGEFIPAAVVEHHEGPSTANRPGEIVGSASMSKAQATEVQEQSHNGTQSIFSTYEEFQYLHAEKIIWCQKLLEGYTRA